MGKRTLRCWMNTVVACSGFAVACVQAADGPDSYAVVALFGDDLSIVYYVPATGSSLDRNDQQHLALSDGHFDTLAAQVSTRAICDVLPSASVESVTLPDDVLAAGLETALPSLLAGAKDRLKDKDTHYLVVIGKYRGDARLKAANGHLGSGKLAGIGFYVDRYLKMHKTDTGEHGRGFVAPFAYLTVSLIDLRTGTVIRSEPVTESMTRANVGPSTTLDPWEALTPDEKIRSLDVVVRRALLRTVPHVVAPA